MIELIRYAKLDPTVFATHRYALAEVEAAYRTFADSTHSQALKVVLQRESAALGSTARELAATTA